MGELPTGTVTFLFTDIEGSTRHWEEHPEAMGDALARHDAILRAAVETHGGQVVKVTGDGVLAVFASAREALVACLGAQRALGDEVGPGQTGPLRVRMGVHTGEAEQRDGDYHGSTLNRAARLMAVAHGGQVLVSESVEPITRDALPDSAGLLDLGTHRLPDLSSGLRVFQLTHPSLRRDFPALRSLDALPGNLPRQVTTFVGRELEIEDLRRLVGDRPLVTLTGVGGVGKTRLALQVAAEVASEFRDGCWLCDLAPVGDPDALWDVIAATLELPPPPGRPLAQAVLEHLATKRLLLVLDNCEHLLDAVADVVEAVLQSAENVTVLATSREGLAIAGEQIVAVRSLGLPPDGATADVLAHASAVRLFVDRAHDAKQDFALTEHNAPVVAQLCRRLDGIPLAIELAAARVRGLTPQELLDRLDQRFRLLTRGSRAGLERHQTLRRTIDWSYDLLTATERSALKRLSVFAGGCDLEAAEAVVAGGELQATDVADVLGQLIDKSLVNVEVDEDAGTRYSLLETIRQYAHERLEEADEAAALRRCHAEHFVGVAERARSELRGRRQLASASAMAREADNFRAALDWALEAESADVALRLVAPLCVAGTTIGYAAMAWADAAREIPGASEHARLPVVIAWAAWGKVIRGDTDQGGVLVAEADAAQQRLGIQEPWVRMAAGTVAFFSGDVARARIEAEEWVRLARLTGDSYELSNSLVMLASALQVSDLDAATAVAEEAVEIARRGGILTALGIGLSVLASLVAVRDPDRALALLDEVVEVGTLVGDRQAVSQVPLIRSWLSLQLEDWPAALRAATDAANAKAAAGDFSTTSGPFFLASMALAGLHALEPAAVLFGAADDAPFWANEWTGGRDRTEAGLIAGLGAARFAELRASGAAKSPAEAVAYLKAEAAHALPAS